MKMSICSEYFLANNGKKVKLEIRDKAEHFVTINIYNLSYDEERKSKLKHLAILIIAYLIYTLLGNSIFLHLGFIIYLICLLYNIFSLVKSESIKICSEFAIQLSTIFFLGFKNNRFITINNIHDIVINEVITELRIQYMLIIRTKGSYFKKKPIVPLFSNLRPHVDCLEIIYNELNSKIFP